MNSGSRRARRPPESSSGWLGIPGRIGRCAVGGAEEDGDSMLDLKIGNARICDGTGSPAKRGAIGVRDGRIVAIQALQAHHGDTGG